MRRLCCVWIARRSDRPRRLPLAGHCARSLRRPARPGWTVLELIVVITITALLLALLLPAIGAVRESARRMDCSTRLREMALALHQYESTYGVFPMGVMARNRLLPYLGEVALADLAERAELQFWSGEESEEVSAALSKRVRPLLCPSEPAEILVGKWAPANYAGNFGSGLWLYGFDGYFCPYDMSSQNAFPQKRLRTSDITDGASNTVAFSEFLPSNGRYDRLRTLWQFEVSGVAPDDYHQVRQICLDLPEDPRFAQVMGDPIYRHGAPWPDVQVGQSMYNHGLPPNSPSCRPSTVQHALYSAGSLHTGGVNAAFGDGHVTFVSEAIDGEVWREMGSRGPSQFLRDVYERQRPEF